MPNMSTELLLVRLRSCMSAKLTGKHRPSLEFVHHFCSQPAKDHNDDTSKKFKEWKDSLTQEKGKRFKSYNVPIRHSLNYVVMQYLVSKKKKWNFDPIRVLNHFVAPGKTKPSTMGGAIVQVCDIKKEVNKKITSS